MNDAIETIESALAHATNPCVTSSFQSECVVLLDLLRARRPDIPVLFVDTGHHFAEMLKFRDDVCARWNLNLLNISAPAIKLGEWRTSTDACCAHNKVAPLFAALEEYDCWFTGLRREQSSTRANLEAATQFRLPTGRSLRKVSPLVAWSTRDVDAYIAVHELPVAPLYAQGYMSIGCEPCTRPTADASNPRSGRWSGARLECGIHIESRQHQREEHE